jgi:hypothetical protein
MAVRYKTNARWLDNNITRRTVSTMPSLGVFSHMSPDSNTISEEKPKTNKNGEKVVIVGQSIVGEDGVVI